MILKNWTERRALSASIRRLRKAAELAGEVAVLWDDQDQYIVNIAEDLRKHAEEAEADIKEALAAREQERAGQ